MNRFPQVINKNTNADLRSNAIFSQAIQEAQAKVRFYQTGLDQWTEALQNLQEVMRLTAMTPSLGETLPGQVTLRKSTFNRNGGYRKPKGFWSDKVRELVTQGKEPGVSYTRKTLQKELQQTVPGSSPSSIYASIYYAIRQGFLREDSRTGRLMPGKDSQ